MLTVLAFLTLSFPRITHNARPEASGDQHLLGVSVKAGFNVDHGKTLQTARSSPIQAAAALTAAKPVLAAPASGPAAPWPLVTPATTAAAEGTGASTAIGDPGPHSVAGQTDVLDGRAERRAYFPPQHKGTRIKMYHQHGRLQNQTNSREFADRKVDKNKLWERFTKGEQDNTNLDKNGNSKSHDGRWFKPTLAQEQNLKFAVDNVQQAGKYMEFASKAIHDKATHQKEVASYMNGRVHEAREAEEKILPNLLREEMGKWDATRVRALSMPVGGDNLTNDTEFYMQILAKQPSQSQEEVAPVTKVAADSASQGMAANKTVAFTNDPAVGHDLLASKKQLGAQLAPQQSKSTVSVADSAD